MESSLFFHKYSIYFIVNYYIKMNNNDYYNDKVLLIESTTESASIDRVIDKINNLAGEVNYFGNEGVNQIMDFVSNAESIVNKQMTNFEGVGESAGKMIDTVNHRFSNWPVQAAIIAGIIGAIIIILLIIFFVVYTIYVFVSWIKLPNEESLSNDVNKKQSTKQNKRSNYGYIENIERQY
uniref:t-SNARE coiled-coil homology domain-containing protein n=2 Tax=Strongyloides stercoralis TaxID=6248 RepID=A0A0K0E8E2_STRER